MRDQNAVQYSEGLNAEQVMRIDKTSGNMYACKLLVQHSKRSERAC